LINNSRWNIQQFNGTALRVCSSCSLTQTKYTVNRRQQSSVGTFMLRSYSGNYSTNIEQNFINFRTIVAWVSKNNGNPILGIFVVWIFTLDCILFLSWLLRPKKFRATLMNQFRPSHCRLHFNSISGMSNTDLQYDFLRDFEIQ